jgi:membrane protease YdiL (CAAX protease family)
VFEASDLIYQAVLAALLAAPFIIALLIRRQPLLSVGLAQRLLRPSLSLGFALALMSIFLQGKLSKILFGLTTSLGYALVAALLIGLAEEFVFRGFIQLRLSGWLGDIQGWLASTGLFVLWRLLIAVLAGASFASLGLTLLYLLAFSLLQGWMMRKCNHIAAPVIFHAVHLWISML